jgi:ABC-type nitrate/sulfonate/bicarbonate transport system substrate-binding protein
MTAQHGPFLAKYAGIKSWNSFARNASLWVMNETNGILRIEPNSRENRGAGYRMEARGRSAYFRALRRLHKELHQRRHLCARNELLEKSPKLAREFLAAWFDAVAYMKSHRDETITLVQPVMRVGPEIAARTYDEMMDGFSDTGRFPPDALKTLARSFVDLGIFEKEPEMSKLYSEAYLPARN